MPLPYSDAAAVDPEEAYIAALAGCHMLCVWTLPGPRGLAREPLHRRGRGTMAQDLKAAWWSAMCRCAGRVSDAAHAPTAAVLADLLHQAHAACFLANSVKTQIDCAPVLQTEGA